MQSISVEPTMSLQARGGPKRAVGVIGAVCAVCGVAFWAVAGGPGHVSAALPAPQALYVHGAFRAPVSQPGVSLVAPVAVPQMPQTFSDFSAMPAARFMNIPARGRSPVMSGVTTAADGAAGTKEYRLRYSEGGKTISPWHDIPLQTGEAGVFNAVFEIPKMTKPKMEVATKEEGNPIAQDEKKGKLRDYHGPIFWNYGMFPQTWEDPNAEDPDTKANGDDDPVDVVEIGSETLAQGAVEKVKVLGALAMIDEGELDWKIIAIRSSDSMAAELNDIQDVEAKMPGTISGIREWFRWYKTPDGKPLNGFGFDEKALDKKKAVEVIGETNQAWKNLRDGKIEKGKLWIGV